MRADLSVVLVLGSFLLGGCANTIPVGGGKSILCISFGDAEKFLEKLGYPNNVSASSISRSIYGDRLFIEFDDLLGHYGPEVTYKVAIISSNGVTVKGLPGQSRLNDEGEPVFWTTWLERTTGPLHFADGYVAPTNVHCYWRCDGKFIGFFRHGHWWIARAESPLEELVFDRQPEPLKNLQLTISWKDRLHVFVRGQPEGKPRPDRWAILKRYEYQVEGNKARLLQLQDFHDTWSAQDFDPESGLLLPNSWGIPFSHGLLINTRTEERKHLRSCHGRGYFVTDAVAKRFREALGDN